MSRKQRMINLTAFLGLLLLTAGTSLHAETTTWDGSTANWNESHWDNGVPQVGDEVVISSGTVTLSNATPALISYTQGGGVLAMTNWMTKLEATTVTLNAGKMQPANAFTNSVMSNRVWIVCTDLTIASGAIINANGLGYAGVYASDGSGPGGGNYDQYNAGGAGHGGRGGISSRGALPGEPYGSIEQPVTPGSSGGGTQNSAGRAGGGAIRIDATGDVIVNGSISAQGLYGHYLGEGAGGSILITCDTIQGSGSLLADGALSLSGGGEGGGGRIAVHYTPASQQAIPIPALEFSVVAGKRALLHSESQFGTIYFLDTTLLSDTMTDMRGWLHIPGFTSWSPSSLTMTDCYLGFPSNDFAFSSGSISGTGNRKLAFKTNATFNVTGNVDANIDMDGAGFWSIGGDWMLTANIDLNYNSVSRYTDVSVGGDLTVANTWRVYSDVTNGNDYGLLVSVTSNMFVEASGKLYLYSHPTNGGSPLLTMVDFTLDENGTINANSGGFGGLLAADGYGPGGGKYEKYNGGGGGYGGKGGTIRGAGGVSNGLAYAPLGPGSAGGGSSGTTGGSGGGLIRIEATGAVAVNGLIEANGSSSGYYNGSGSGGGVFIKSETFQGSATSVLRANGGKVNQGGSGGGGRIAIWYGELADVDRAAILAGEVDFGDRLTATTTYAPFLGTAEALKGADNEGAEDGTVYFINVIPAKLGTLIIIQ